LKAALLYGINDLRVVDVDRPQAGPGDILAKVKVCGVCPTDVRKYRTGNHGVSKLPFNMGHEWAGDLVEVGEGVKGFDVGMRVGGANYGGYAEFNCVRRAEFEEFAPYSEALLMPIPDNLSYEQAVFIEPLADCFHAVVTQAQTQVGDTMLVIGSGQMGIQIMMAAKSIGAKVILADMLKERLRLGFEFGADETVNTSKSNLKDEVMKITRGKGADVVITSVAEPSAIVRGLELVKKRGKVVIFGGAPTGTMIQLDPNLVHYNEVSLLGSEWIGAGGFLDARMCHVALEMIQSRRIPVDRLISHRYALEQIHEAFRAIENREALKCVIAMA